MSTINNNDNEKEIPIEESLEWGKWGDGKTKPEMKNFFELLLKYNNQTKKILEETKKWLISNGNNSR
jgi:hypothetical protein